MNATAETIADGAECRIYVACLASYNNGVLHGRWIDVDGKDADDLQGEVNEILRSSPYPNVTVNCPDCSEHDPCEIMPCATCGGRGKVPSAEEFAIHDHEGFGRMIGEYTPLDDVAAIAEALIGDYPLAFRWLVEDRGMVASEAAGKAEEVSIYQDAEAWSEDKLLASYAQELAEDCYSDALKGPLANYIDFEAFGRDLKMGGDVDVAEIDGERFLVTNASEF